MTVSWKKRAEEQRQAELRRGQEVIARNLIAERFDPSYTPPEGWVNEGPSVSPTERRRRDEYKKNLPNGRW